MLPAVVRDLTRLVVPVACPGCGERDVRWCATCAVALGGEPTRVEAAAPRLDRLDDVPPLPVWALAAYAGQVRDLVVAWKDRGRVDLDRLVAPPLQRAALDLAPALRATTAGRPVLVVPAPSSGAALRSRGRNHVAVLAQAVAHGLADGGTPCAVVPALRRRGRGTDQVGLGARARGRNLAGSVTVRDAGLRARAGGAGPLCLLVDDVITTGATMAAAERALEARGADVLAALVLAATPPPGRHDLPTPDRRAAVYLPGEDALAWGSDDGRRPAGSVRTTHERVGP